MTGSNRVVGAAVALVVIFTLFLPAVSHAETDVVVADVGFSGAYNLEASGTYNAADGNHNDYDGTHDIHGAIRGVHNGTAWRAYFTMGFWPTSLNVTSAGLCSQATNSVSFSTSGNNLFPESDPNIGDEEESLIENEIYYDFSSFSPVYGVYGDHVITSLSLSGSWETDATNPVSWSGSIRVDVSTATESFSLIDVPIRGTQQLLPGIILQRAWPYNPTGTNLGCISGSQSPFTYIGAGAVARETAV